MYQLLLVMAGGAPDEFLVTLAARLRDDFRIGHTTVQVETGAACACPLERSAA